MRQACDADRAVGRAVAIRLEGVSYHVDRLGVVFQLLAILAARLRLVQVRKPIRCLPFRPLTAWPPWCDGRAWRFRPNDIRRRWRASIRRGRMPDRRRNSASPRLCRYCTRSRSRYCMKSSALPEQSRQGMREDYVYRMPVRLGEVRSFRERRDDGRRWRCPLRRRPERYVPRCPRPSARRWQSDPARTDRYFLAAWSKPARVDEDALTRERVVSHNQALRTARRSRRRTAGRSARPPARASTADRRRPR